MPLARVLLFFCVLAATVAPVRAADQAGTVLGRLATTAGGVRSLSSDLTQEKRLAVFQETLVSRGRFFYRRPDGLRWEIASPAVAGFALQGERGVRWRAAGRPEPFTLAADPVMGVVARQLLAWAGGDVAAIARDYRVTVLAEDPASLRLEPREANSSGFLDHLEVRFAPGGRSLASVRLVERRGDSTLLTFSNTRLDEPLADRLFREP